MGDLIELFSGSYTTNAELQSFKITLDIFIRTHIRKKLRGDMVIKYNRLTNIEYDGMDRAFFDIKQTYLKYAITCDKCQKIHYFVRMWNIKEIEPGVIKIDYTLFRDNRQCTA
jgi:hypothetical protein